MNAHTAGRGARFRPLFLAPLAFAGTLAITAVVGLATAAIADASTISYIGNDGNVNLISPDGERKLQLTDDATADNKYRSPSQTDSGRTVAMRKASGAISMAFFFDRQGNMVDSWNLPASGLGLRFSPFSGGQIAPDGNGGMMVYDYFHAEGPPTYANEVRVGFVAAGGLTNPCTINCHGGYLRPRWLPGTPHAGFVADDFNSVQVQTQGGVQSWIGVNDPNATSISSFDVARSGGQVVVESSAEGSSAANFEFFTFNGVASDRPGINFACIAQNIAKTTAAPRFSPDGTMIAWEGPEGVYVAPTPTNRGDGFCNLVPRLVAPGGTQPDWGKLDLPAPDDGGDDGGVIVPDEPKQPVEDAVKKGLVVELQCPEACKASITAKVNKATARKYGLGKKATVVAKGSGEIAGPGKVAVELRFKSKAKRKLVKAKTLKLALTAKVTTASGAVQTLTDSLTLKR
jgi:hypothetical protein